MTRRTVLITGASGFVGQAVTAALLQSEDVCVHTVARRELNHGETAAQHHRCDLLERQETSALLESVRPDVLIHSAWFAEHGKFWNAPENLDWVGATLHLLRAFHAAGGARFVGVGSCAEYAWTTSEDLHEQNARLDPSTLYGVAKDATRRVVQSYSDGAGLDWAWTRLFMMYGPGEASSRLLPSIALPLLRGEHAESSSGEQLRDFLHVHDVARGIACVALSDVTGPVNVASGVATSVRDFSAEIARATGPGATVERGALPQRSGEPQRIVADIARLRSLGFEPQFDLQAGVASAVQELRS